MSANPWPQANRSFFASGVWKTLKEDGRRIYKYPTDLWVYEEIIRRTQPEVIVETGSAEGGSAAWFSRFAPVISVDLHPPKANLDRVIWIQGDSVKMAKTVEDFVKGRRVMVTLDSNHSAAHVLRELDAYAYIASDYMVVEDTAVDAYGLDDYPDGGPGAALDRWLPTHQEWQPDSDCDRFMLGMNPGGWLRRVG